jgi:predicted nucleotidyltransferase
MQTIALAFNDFLKKLKLTDSEQSEASRQHTNMRTELQKRLEVEDNFLSGSYKRKTAVRPLNDIDIFVVLSETDEVNRVLGPDALLDTLQTTLEAIYPQKTTTRQARSINIEFTGTGIAYDVVPAFSDGDDAYVIPGGASSWMPTNPKTHKTLSTEANEKAGKMLKPLLKAVKHAKNVHEAQARSFHLEVLSWGILTSKPTSHMDGLVSLLEGLAEQICEPCEDPAGLGPDIRPSVDRCLAAKGWLANMAKLAADARTLAANGKVGEAHAKMCEIFGAQWPEKGSKSESKIGAPAIVLSGGSVDDPRDKFG